MLNGWWIIADKPNAVQESMERHMLDAGTHADYVQEMEKSLSEGKVRRLSQQEMAELAWTTALHNNLRRREAGKSVDEDQGRRQFGHEKCQGKTLSQPVHVARSQCLD